MANTLTPAELSAKVCEMCPEWCWAKQMHADGWATDWYCELGDDPEECPEAVDYLREVERQELERQDDEERERECRDFRRADYLPFAR